MDAVVKTKVDAFFEKHKRQTYKKGELLIRADDDPAGIFYLTQGIVRQYAITKDGDEQTVTLYKTPSFFPMMWALANLPNTYYFEAMTQVTVWRAPKDDVLAFLRAEPDVLLDLTTRLYRGMHGLLTRIQYLQTGNAMANIVFAILNTAHRFGEHQSSNKATTLRITHRELAALTGLTKETISREMTKLEAQGLVKNTNHVVTIPNIKLLEDALGSL